MEYKLLDLRVYVSIHNKLLVDFVTCITQSIYPVIYDKNGLVCKNI